MISTLSDALAERGYDTLTEVQTAVTAPELAEADLLVSAQTGSGKTVGFGLAIAPTLLGEEPRFDRPELPLALVVAPTRELAMQVQRELAWLYGKAGARVVSCIGGMDARDERRALERGSHIVVGTPGRLRDHITRGSLDLSSIRAIVMDEADEMLDLGFREDLEFMLDAAPDERRTLLFSATVPPAIAEMAKTFQRDAVRVKTTSKGSQHSDISYQVVQVAAHDAEHAIINLLRFHDAPRSIVFANTRAAVARLTARLANRGLSVVSLSGELSQDERSHALQAMRDGRARVCVATDVAARGIDLPNLNLVIHADLPTNTEALLHRSGRTGRAGRKGVSALIVPDKASKKASRLLKWAKIEAEWVHAPTAEDILALDETRLLEDPAWENELTEAETAFAQKMIETHTPEQIAAACLRLYRSRLSAPEELNTRPVEEPRKERAPFGPSTWIELSVGRAGRAEPRWLLPLLCRAGGLEKADIGKIRVQDDTTLVEITEASAPRLMEKLGPDGVLEDDITAKAFDGVPEAAPQRPRGGPRFDKPRFDKPRHDGPRREKSYHDKPRHDGDKPARKPWSDKGKVTKNDEARKSGALEDFHRPAKPGKPHFKDGDRKPQGGKGKPGGFKSGPKGKSFGGAGKSHDDKGFGGKGKPAGKPASKARPGAGDTSRRMERPGGKRPKLGGDMPPRRKG